MATDCFFSTQSNPSSHTKCLFTCTKSPP